jgi:hypothetical protein
MKAVFSFVVLALMCSIARSAETNGFLEDNWGQANNGFQLSLCLEKHTFTNGEPVVAILLLRNVTNTNLRLQYFPRFPVKYSSSPLGFEVTSETGQVLIENENILPTITSQLSPSQLDSGSQAKFVAQIDKKFNLTNGIYSIKAVMEAISGPFPQIDTNDLSGVNYNIANIHDAFSNPQFAKAMSNALINAYARASKTTVTVKVKSAEVKIKIGNSPL